MKLSKKQTILTAGVGALVVGSSVSALVLLNQPNQHNPVAQATNQPHATLNVTDDNAQAPDEPTTQPVDVSPTPSVVPTDSPAPAPAPVTYKWSADMAKAGIASSDYDYVTQMVLDDNGWRTSGPKLWQKYNAPFGGDGSLSAHIAFANRWVLQYHGSWSAAYNLWVNAGNF